MMKLRYLLITTFYLKTIHKTKAGWIDPDTPEEAYTINSLKVIRPKNQSLPSYTSKQKGKIFHLVMSDEFNVPNRTFHDGNDPLWTALEKNDYTNDALHYYDPNNIQTNEEGELQIMSTAEDTNIVGFDDVNRKRVALKKHFKSGMLQSWNKFCYTGGILEAEVILPGFADVGGLWPAMWILGNLARHTYVGSSMHVWPWSSNKCNEHTFKAQKINACQHAAHYGLKEGEGRGAPEIDIFEVQPGPFKGNEGAFWQMPVGQPFMSASYQVAPGKSGYRPGNNWWPAPGQWYENLKFGEDTCLNILFYGSFNAFRGETDPEKAYWSDALSFNRQLNDDHFEKRHRYRLEWDLPSNKTKGYLHWFLNDELIFALDGESIEAAGYGAHISNEPSSIILNTAISMQWGFPKCPKDCPCEVFDCHSLKHEENCAFPPGFCLMLENKPKYKINWVRVYQDKDDEKQKIGCSTPEKPTRRYIDANADLYKRESDEHPLKSIQKGRGFCTFGSREVGPDGCGGPERGTCTFGRACECKEEWTGPHCLSHEGFNDIEYDVMDSIVDLEFSPPGRVPIRLLTAVCLSFIVLLMYTTLRRNQYDGYEPVVEDIGK